MTNSKKALLLTTKSDCARSLQLAESLYSQGYDLYAKGEMVLFFNQNMIPVSAYPDGYAMEFDCVVH